MSYSAPTIEFTRFFGRVGGLGIGCCAIDLIQGFVNDPDGPAVVPIYNGDGINRDSKGKGTFSMQALTRDGEAAYLGKTNHEVFLNYLRIGTFDTRDMPNRIFLASLTAYQCGGNDSVGTKWLKILKENGFEFIRTTDNSVYTGSGVKKTPGKGCSHDVYLFGLFRNIGTTSVKDPFQPPKAWVALSDELRTPDGTVVKNQNELWLAQKTKIYKASEVGVTPAAKTPSPFAKDDLSVTA